MTRLTPPPPSLPRQVVQETVAQRIRGLQDQARALARDHVQQLQQQMIAAAATAQEIANGGDAYPPGVRDLARRFVEDCETRVQAIEAINTRQKS